MDGSETTGYKSMNAGFNAAYSIKARLDTAEVITKLKLYLEGKVETLDANTGQIQIAEVGKAKMNQEGVQSVLMFVSSMVNPSTVQGHYDKSEKLDAFLADKHEELVKSIVVNRPHWGVRSEEIGLITQAIMGLLEPFMSRTLYNKERESYANTMKSVETTVNNGRSGFFGLG